MVFTGVCFRFLICGPLSQFHVGCCFSLSPSRCLFLPHWIASLHRFGWLIYHSDYCPLCTLENCSLRTREREILAAAATRHTIEVDAFVMMLHPNNKREEKITHGRTKLNNTTSLFLLHFGDCMQITELQTLTFYRIKCITHE